MAIKHHIAGGKSTYWPPYTAAENARWMRTSTASRTAGLTSSSTPTPAAMLLLGSARSLNGSDRSKTSWRTAPTRG